MLILTSPSKRLDFEHKLPDEVIATIPKFVEHANDIARSLSKLTQKQLSKVLEVSDSLAELNHERFQNWKPNHSKANSKQAIWAYQGDVYTKINQNEFSKQKIEYAQNSLRIISGLYGALKPYDLIQPYRLEMKVKYKVDGKSRPTSYWKEELTTYLKREIKRNNHKYVINCASNEYSKAINLKELGVPVYEIKFKQMKGKKEMSLMMPVKFARGMMINYLIQNEVTELDQIKKFREDGYKFAEETPNTLKFVKQDYRSLD